MQYIRYSVIASLLDILTDPKLWNCSNKKGSYSCKVWWRHFLPVGFVSTGSDLEAQLSSTSWLCPLNAWLLRASWAWVSNQQMIEKQEAQAWEVTNKLHLEAAQSFLFQFQWLVNSGLAVTPDYDSARLPGLTVCLGKEKPGLVSRWWVFTTISLHQSTIGWVGEVTVGKHLFQDLLQ